VSIPDIYEKFKGRVDGVRGALSSGIPLDAFVVVTVILVGFAGFGLGRLSAVDVEKKPVHIDYPQVAEKKEPASKVSALAISPKVITAAAVSTGQKLVASKNGTKYHLPDCPGAGRITEVNKIWFGSEEEARKAGYTPASNCKGL